MKKVPWATVTRVMLNIPRVVLLQLQNDSNVVLAGGVIRSCQADEAIEDVDVFCNSKEKAEQLALEVAHNRESVVQTSCAYSVWHEDTKIQYIFYSPFKNAEDLVQQFDFLACSAGIWYDENRRTQSICLKGWEEDVNEKKLTFMQRDKDKGSLVPLRRALNFVKRGWSISDGELAKIVHHFNPSIPLNTTRGSFKYGYNQDRSEVDPSFSES